MIVTSNWKDRDENRERRLERPCLIPEIEKLIRCTFYDKVHQKFDNEERREDELLRYREKYVGQQVEEIKQEAAD